MHAVQTRADRHEQQGERRRTDYDVAAEGAPGDSTGAVAPALDIAALASLLQRLGEAETIALLQQLEPRLLLRALETRLVREESEAPRPPAPEAEQQAVTHQSDVAPEPDDQRCCERRPMMRLGRIIYNNQMCVIDCTLRDKSPGGCRVSVSSTLGVPNNFVLEIKGSGERHDCEIVWRTSDEIGLRFLN